MILCPQKSRTHADEYGHIKSHKTEKAPENRELFAIMDNYGHSIGAEGGPHIFP